MYLSANIRDVQRVAVCICFVARTAETTFVDMTLECVRMWVAHTEFDTCHYAIGQMLRLVGKCPMFSHYFAHCFV